MRVTLAYGRNGLDCDLPDNSVVLEPIYDHGLQDESEGILHALRNPISSQPLTELAQPGDSVVIVHTDITRPTPNDRILPLILCELEQAGVHREDITLLNGLGTHRPQTDSELRKMLGSDIVDSFRCLQHDSLDDQQLVSLGFTKLGHPVRINKHYLNSKIKILTGFIEPHVEAGFSGGPKAILPALSGAESVYTNHGFKLIGDPRSTFGITEGNPLWEEMLEVANRTNPTFLLNVAMNKDHQITAVFAGDMVKAHRVGCRYVKERSMIRVDAPFDIIITTNGGYPLDLDLYQSMKGVSAADQVIKPGGTIILASACEEGIPIPSGYADLVPLGETPQGILNLVSQPGFAYHQQWEAQLQAMIQLHADIHVYSDGLTDEDIIKMLMVPCRSIEHTVGKLLQKYGPTSRICVLPQGPQTIPYLH